MIDELEIQLAETLKAERLIDDRLKETAFEAAAAELVAQRALKPALADIRLTEGLTAAAAESALPELIAAQALKPALAEVGLTGRTKELEEAPLDEFAASHVLKPALRDESPESLDILAESILSRIKLKAQKTLQGIPYLDWVATAFAVGFALVITAVRYDSIRSLMSKGEWPLLFATFAVLLSASTLLFNASRLVNIDASINNKIFGRKMAGLVRFEMAVAQIFGVVLIGIFCWMFFGLTNSHRLLMPF